MIDNTGPAFWGSVPFGFDQTKVGALWTLPSQYQGLFIDSGAVGSTGSIRTVQGRTNKRYIEFTIDIIPAPNATTDIEFGLYTVANGINVPAVKNASPGCAYCSTVHAVGNIGFVNVNGGTTVPSTTVLLAGNTVTIAVNCATGDFWIGPDQAWIGGGNPAAGSTPTGNIGANTWYAAVGIDESSGTPSPGFAVTMRSLTGSTILPVPSGFSCWDD